MSLRRLFGKKPESETAVVDGYREDDIRRGKTCLADLKPKVPENCGTIVTDMGTYFFHCVQGDLELKLEVFDVYHEGVQIRAIFLRDGRVFIRNYELEDEDYLRIIPNLTEQARKYFATH